MRPEEALAAWSQACDGAGVDWYIFKDTLLCAHGYEAFPQELTCAQIAVRGVDMPRIRREVFPRLPENWKLDLVDFFTNKQRDLCFQAEKVPVLSLHILCGAESQQHMDSLAAVTRGRWYKTRSRVRILRCLPLGIGKKLARKIAGKTVNDLMDRLGAWEENQLYCCDCFANDEPVLLEKRLFADKQWLSCGSVDYPVMGNYTAYLEVVYGDYENGLTDEVGVGLTVEEKQALKNHQQRCLQALAFVQEVSREFGLRYYLLAGSVLGAVRHGGFIPWDDDVDIGIRAEELDRFEEIIKQELPKRLPRGFELIQPAANFAYPWIFSKICYEGRCCMDLWPLVPTYVSGVRALFTWFFGKLMTRVHYFKVGRVMAGHKKLIRLVGCFMTDKMTLGLARWNRLKYARRKTPAYINLHSIYRREKETILRIWLEDERTANFDGLQVPVVGCTEEYLTHLYGDYMARPAPWKRASRHADRF